VITDVLIWGAGGHASVVADAVRCARKFSIAGFIDEVRPERSGEAWAGATILGGLDVLQAIAGRDTLALIPGVGDTSARLRMIETAKSFGLPLASVVHPAAVIASDAAIGAGSVAFAGVIVNAGTTIGSAVILNTAATVDHHCDIGDAAHIAPGAHLGGNVRVGRGAWIGIGAIVRDGLTIGEDTIVGAGAVVIRDVTDGEVVVGNPARFLKRNRRATHPS
jgi:UDP-N-acetylbacillosamine N-acetyltransferase